ncbi:MAG: hypothetical protein OXE87_06845 [Chloroflexi bacterium]|nr:hypothetical protein [Chloroflexota bacterium]
MVTTATRQNETDVAVVAPVVETAAVDISAIPESPAELLEQWDTPKRSVVQMIASVWNQVWDAVTGPAKTEQERVNRKIFEHNRYFRSQGPHF